MKRVTGAVLGSMTALALLVQGPTGMASAQAPAEAVAPAARGSDVRKVIEPTAPDPGFLHADGRYFIFATGAGFKVRSSTSPMSGYGGAHRSMRKRVPWAKRPGKGHYWAPHVFEVPRRKDGTRFVMYFTATKPGHGGDCIGVATSARASRNFVPKRRPLFCAAKGTTTIDPSAFRTGHGQRHLIYKARRGDSYQIRRIRLNDAGTRVHKGARSRLMVAGHGRNVEAPQLVRHDGKLWLFTSRSPYTSCKYHTELYVAGSLGGTFRAKGEMPIRRRNGDPLCGPGGAEVVRDGHTWHIAFHAYPGMNDDAKRRPAWVGKLRWNKDGRPFVPRA